METLKFLRGKYNGGEQILPGVIQTYRATEAATGRSVFVHRVSSTDDAGQQLALYRLLAAALVRSPSVRSMVLDMRDENNDWFVVTDTAPQCLLLREWLQFELGNSAKMSDGKKEIVAKPVLSTPAPPEPVQKPASDPSLVPTTLPPATHPEGPGEFTRLFTGDLPASSSKPSRAVERPSNPDLLRKEDRPGRSGSVQRPHTPMPFVPPVAPHGTEPGEFTRLFSKEGASESGQKPRPPLERPKASTDHQDLFKSRSEPMVPTPPAAQGPGEYTRIFGKGDAPPPVQERSALGKGAPGNHDDPLMASEPGTVNGPKGQTTAGPGEYTRVLEGNRPPVSTAVEPPRQVTGGSVDASGSQIPMPANPLGKMPISSLSASVTGPSVANPMGSAHVNAPHLQMPNVPAPHLSAQTPNVQPSPAAVGAKSAASASTKNTKMIIFFAALGLLALILVLLVVLAWRK
jgi:hypothetical protein